MKSMNEYLFNITEDISYLTEATYTGKITEYDKEFNEIERAIKKSTRVFVYAHISTDSDAINSSRVLAEGIRLKHKKEVYVVLENDKQIYPTMKGDIAIFLDVSTYDRISRDNTVKETFMNKTNTFQTIRIDHHPSKMESNPILSDITIEDTKAGSTCEIITLFLENKGYKITKQMGENLFKGIIADNGRFQYSLTKTALIATAILTEYGIDYKDVYNKMYLKSPQYLRGKQYVITRKKVSTNGVTYLLVDDKRAKEFDFSRGEAAAMVHELAEDRSSKIWVIGNELGNKINCRVRSRDINITNVCKMFGGGGHENACGVQVRNREEFAQLVYQLDQLLLRGKLR